MGSLTRGQRASTDSADRHPKSRQASHQCNKSAADLRDECVVQGGVEGVCGSTGKAFATPP